MYKPIKKIRKGLVNLIEGLIEDTELINKVKNTKEMRNIMEPYIITGILSTRMEKIKEYLSNAEIYLEKKELEKLKLKYNSLKARIEN